MQGHRRRQATQRSPATSISPKGGGGTAAISLSLLLHDVTDIASSSLRELDAVALATNVTIFMERGTYLRALTLPFSCFPDAATGSGWHRNHTFRADGLR